MISPARGTLIRANGQAPRLVSFKKYHGLGNDFVLVDNRESEEPCMSPEEASTMCDRNFGVGADGVIFALASKAGANYRMRIYNSDGSEPEMCGNGIRCMAKFLQELEGKSGSGVTYNIDTLAGAIVPEIHENGQVTVDMGCPILEGAAVPTTITPTRQGDKVVNAPVEIAQRLWEVTCVSMGNPHAVVFVDDLDSLDFEVLGPLFESDPAFPARVNTEFVEVLSPSHLKMKVWERGAGPTLACGTGACALTVAAILAGKTTERTCTVSLPGGDLVIEWREENNRCYMTGPATAVFSGVYAVE